MIGKVTSPVSMRPITMEKRLQDRIHAHPVELIWICREAKWSSTELGENVRHVS